MHTPGPWHTGGVFDPNGSSPNQWVWSKTQKGDQSGIVIAKEVRVCDVSLIAAAPELLGVLRKIADAPLHWTRDDFALEARLVIAKATGEQE